MVPHGRNGRNGLGLRVFAATTTLLTGALLAGCGQQAGSANELSNAAGEAMGASGDSVAGAADTSTSRTRTDDSTAGERTGRSPTESSTASSPSESRESNGRTPTSTEHPPPVSRCHTGSLDGSLKRGHPGAGQRYAELTVRNTGDSTCTLYGYPGLELLDESGSPLPTDVSRTADPGPSTLRLAPDETSSAQLHWGVVPTGTDPAGSSCEPVPAGVRVTPPDETDSFRLDWNLGRVCGGDVDVTAFR
ncbi:MULTISPECIES: DUF4232 domain-containing protein [unclassified Actinopolyspora]|uniref:DUF4232 domain-containing protein n=1 Tax=unclassified Actinopolyspora TaxID=2639451 RepID=UPI0013F620CE|nr:MULTISPECIES: DUF4232 domain-containing protein [unclassified Actinopolyspora]NHD18179.1 DUF4232 domain-containing protein [Actinopolyspora sp. BKK2]NHE77142.1 DUF4232 domain-containing protein [Actinopolyspora sp. BKK1]